MNKNPVIIQLDDEENYHVIVDLICYNMDLSIAARAHNIAEAKEIIAQVAAKKLVPDVAIVTSMLEIDIDDGKLFVERLKEIVPNVKIIAYTNDDEAKWGDKLAMKTSRDTTTTIINALEEYTGHKFKFSNVQE